MKKLAYLSVALCISPAFAGEVDVPNVFTAGSPAVAAEVNGNFAAVESAVDDNAAAIGDLQAGLGVAGIGVRLDGDHIGRYLGHGRQPVELDLAPPGTGTVLVGEAVSLASTDAINLLSPTGYRFSIATSDLEEPTQLLGEGVLRHGPVFFDDATCAGNRYFPVEGDTGFFTGFVLGGGGPRPAKPWALRQGVVWASPDPDDVNPAYMIRRGQTVQTVPLLSILIWAGNLQAPFCVDVSNIPGFDINNPAHVNNTAFAVEPVDAVETGVAGRLGGNITIGI